MDDAQGLEDGCITAASALVSAIHHHPLPSSRAFLIWLLKSQRSLQHLVLQQHLWKVASQFLPPVPA